MALAENGNDGEGKGKPETRKGTNWWLLWKVGQVR